MRVDPPTSSHASSVPFGMELPRFKVVPPPFPPFKERATTHFALSVPVSPLFSALVFSFRSVVGQAILYLIQLVSRGHQLIQRWHLSARESISSLAGSLNRPVIPRRPRLRSPAHQLRARSAQRPSVGQSDPLHGSGSEGIWQVDAIVLQPHVAHS